MLRVLLGVNFFMSPCVRTKNNNFLTVLCFNYRNEIMDALLLLKLNLIISDVNQSEAECIVFKIMIPEAQLGCVTKRRSIEQYLYFCTD